MAALLTPAQERTRREAYRALAVLLALEITGNNRDDDEPMPCCLGEPETGPKDAANSPFPSDESASGTGA